MEVKLEGVAALRVRKLMRKIAQARIEGESQHQMRDAAHLAPFVRHAKVESGADIRTTRDLLGHNDGQTTQIYLPTMNRPVLAAKFAFDV